MQFAKDTTVSVEKTRAEIESTVNKYGATGFMSGWQGSQAMVAFELKDRRVRFLLPLPDKNEREFTHTPVQRSRRSDTEAFKAWEQGCRQRWRALALAIKAKLEAVESKIATFDEEFMAHIVLPNGMTIGETMIPRLSEVIATGNIPPLLPGPGQSTAN